MKTSPTHRSPAARSLPVPAAVLRHSLLQLLARCYGGHWLDQATPGRRLHREAAVAARRGDAGARDFLTALRHEQAA